MCKSVGGAGWGVRNWVVWVEQELGCEGKGCGSVWNHDGCEVWGWMMCGGWWVGQARCGYGSRARSSVRGVVGGAEAG